MNQYTATGMLVRMRNAIMNGHVGIVYLALTPFFDVFQRSLLRRVVGTRRIEKMSNMDWQ